MNTRRRQKRKGNVLALTVVMMVALFAFLAFAIDLGYLHVARTELQRTADAAAIAATGDLIDRDALYGDSSPWLIALSARNTAVQFALANPVTTQHPTLAWEDVTVGYLANPFDPSSQLDPNSSNPPNAAQVRVRRTTDRNGEVPLFFARVLGFDTSAVEAQATAALLTSFRGFRVPSSGEPLGILPFALDLQTWEDLLAGVGTDGWSWNSGLEEATGGPDGILEVNLFPQDVGEPGNRGTVDIGGDNNSTADLARQISEGISAEDLEHHDGKLELDENGEFVLNGDTGISAGVKDELATLKGETRTIFLFREVSGPGNNAQYTIVGFAGIRIMDVNLTGNMSNKRVIVQPAIVVSQGGIPATAGQPSHFVYSPVWLVR